MSTELAGKKALVVGASGGIGSDIAVALAQEGIATALIGRNAEALAETANACAKAGAQAVSIVCDISQTATLEGVATDAIRKLGGLNYLINCAGTYYGGKGQEVNLDAWDTMLDINLRAHYYLSRYTLPEINKQPGGAIIKIGSITGTASGTGMHVATCHALDGFSGALFEDVREFGTKVCVIRPGYVNTSLARSDRVDPALMIQPEDISRTILFVLAMPGTACPTEIVIRPQRTPHRAK